MNSSGKTYEPIYGFDISFLPKVILTIMLWKKNLIFCAIDLVTFNKS